MVEVPSGEACTARICVAQAECAVGVGTWLGAAVGRRRGGDAAGLGAQLGACTFRASSTALGARRAVVDTVCPVTRSMMGVKASATMVRCSMQAGDTGGA